MPIPNCFSTWKGGKILAKRVFQESIIFRDPALRPFTKFKYVVITAYMDVNAILNVYFDVDPTPVWRELVVSILL